MDPSPPATQSVCFNLSVQMMCCLQRKRSAADVLRAFSHDAEPVQVRTEVANKETEDFQRVAKRLKSEAAHYKSQARFYQKSLEEMESQSAHVQSETAALFDFNRELFGTAERATLKLATVITVKRELLRRFQVSTAGGRAWRAWSKLCVFRRWSSMFIIISIRRKIRTFKQAVLREWERAAHLRRRIRHCLGVWSRTTRQHRSSRERRGEVVLF